MSDDKKLKNAQKVYKTLCAMLDDNDFKYEKFEEDLVVKFSVRGEDIPMQFVLGIDVDRQLIRLLSPIPVTFGNDKRLEGAVATCQINYRLVDGSFDYDFVKGEVCFRMTSSFRDGLISKELFHYMIAVSCHTIDDYNDKFLMLSKGMIDIKDFLKQ